MAADSHRILIIDDEPLILSSLLSILSERFEVITAEEGISGLTIFNERHPSLVLVDLNMPLMSGVDVLERIRETDLIVPVFVMTGKEPALISAPGCFWPKRCAELGVTGYVVKPFVPGRLIRQIEKAVNQGNRGK